MPAPVDMAVVAARALLFVVALQAAGASLFQLLIPIASAPVDRAIRRLSLCAAALTIILVVLRSVLEPARMAGDFTGMADEFLWSLLWQSDVANAQALRLLGAAGLLLAACIRGRIATAVRLLAVIAIVASFLSMGHTRAHSPSALLAALLAVHVAAVAFWLGSLLPLLVVLHHERGQVAARLVERFSRIALGVVAALALAGASLAALLLESLAALGTTYGLLMITKVATLLGLLALAAANRYRWSPQLAAGDPATARTLSRSIVAEVVLMLFVIAVTATMTTLYSPS